jgi:very-short-patch-repair endonuclease
VKDCELVLRYLELQDLRSKAADFYDVLIASHTHIDFFSLSDTPEQTAVNMIPKIELYLDWYENYAPELKELTQKAGLNEQLIFSFSEFDNEENQTQKLLHAAVDDDKLPLYITLARAYLTWEEIREKKKEKLDLLSESRGSQICLNLDSAINSDDVDAYKKNYETLCLTFSKYEKLSLRNHLLSKVAYQAPSWAEHIKNHIGIHGETVPPNEIIYEGWKYAYLNGYLKKLTGLPYDKLLRRSTELSNLLVNVTSQLCSYMAWNHFILNNKDSAKSAQTLNAFKMTMKRIGKGMGKNAQVYRKQLKDLMSECQQIVPAWVMDLSKALEIFKTDTNTFDVVIIDEASQCDLSALAVCFMAKKVIIVGDDEQVSPMAVGFDNKKLEAIRDMYLKDVISNWHLYDVNTSIYDVARANFKPLLLREHFRSVGEIIGFANSRIYNGKIKTLRDSSTAKVFPAIVDFKVEGARRSESDKTNELEAEWTAALVVACCEHPSYADLSIGVMSLLGEKQALLIMQILFKHLEANVIEEHAIICGNPSHLQGDERDVVFLSMVDSNDEASGPLRLYSIESDTSRKQRFNVATTRARDQLWVIHSLDISKDLKPTDIRRELIEYVRKVYVSVEEERPEETDNSKTTFERQVSGILRRLGYKIVQQKEAGNYILDMVAVYGNDKIAIECDGDDYSAVDEPIKESMQQQITLEQVGWRFIRIRGSEFFYDPEKTISRVCRELSANGIYPEVTKAGKVNPSKDIYEDYHSVTKRAEVLISQWHRESLKSAQTLEAEFLSGEPSQHVPSETVS